MDDYQEYREGLIIERVSMHNLTQQKGHLMENLTLIPPTKANKTAILAFKNEFFQAGERVINGSAFLDQMDYEEWLENIRRNRGYVCYVRRGAGKDLSVACFL